MRTKVTALGGELLAAAFFTLAFGAAHARDLVQLRNGRVLEGRVIKETKDVVILRVANGTVRIEQADVFSIERGQALPSWKVDLRREQKKQRAKRAAELAAKAAEIRKIWREAVSGKDEARLHQLVEDLASNDPDTRRQARALLEREGRAAVPTLTGALAHRSGFARESAASLLGKIGARASVKAMLIALRSAVPDKKKVLHWQRPFVRALRTSLVSITRKDFGLSVYAGGQGKAVEKYISWWDGAAVKGKPDEVPNGACVTWDTPQVGEEEVDPDDAEREKKLWGARRVGGARYSYTPPKTPIERIFGARGSGP